MIKQIVALSFVLFVVPIASFDISLSSWKERVFPKPRYGRIKTALSVSELHIPGYKQTKVPFLLKETDTTSPLTLNIQTYAQNEDYVSMIPFESGYLLHVTKKPILTRYECQSIIDEAEFIASKIGWTTKRVSVWK